MSASESLLTAPWSERRSGEHLNRVNDWREWHDRDRARIIHSAGFRRLQAKMQALGVSEGDFHRTRLTHSQEAAQIAQSIVRYLASPMAATRAEDSVLLPPASLAEAMALAHDVGHPPFGHGGEVALNWCMRNAGGFEGNGQTLRLLARLEAHTGEYGLDLARRTLLGILKYPASYGRVCTLPGASEPDFARATLWRPPKCFHDEEAEVVDWVLAPFDAEDRRRFQEIAPPAARDTDDRPNHGKPLHKSLDATITELADDIAYGVHDLEDAIALRLVPQEMLLATWAEHAKTIAQFRGAPAENDIRDLFKSESARKRAIGLLVNFFIIHVRLHRQGRFMHPLLDSQANLDTGARGFLMALSKLVMEQVILRPSAQMVEFRGQLIVQRIFETIAADPDRFLDQRYLCVWREAADERGRLRTVCDCIAAMTDEYATRVYERLFVPRARSAFEPD